MSFEYYLVRPLPIIQFDLNFFYLFKDILMILPVTTLRLALVVFNSYLSILNCRCFHSYSFPCSLVHAVIWMAVLNKLTFETRYRKTRKVYEGTFSTPLAIRYPLSIKLIDMDNFSLIPN